MLPGKKFTPQDIIDILVRRRWLILLPLAAGIAAAPFIAARIPELYRSEALIMVIPQRVPDDYVKSTVTGSVGERLTSINELILSRSRLERVINDFNLYGEQRTAGPMEDVVQKMRSDITVRVEGRSQTFRVSYVSREPQTAQKVTQRLASLYIEENLRDRSNLAEGTSLFLESQLEEAKRRLLEHEGKLEDYRRRNAGELPSQLTANLQALQSTQMQFNSTAEAINRARERRLLVERQIADLELMAPPPPPGPDDDAPLRPSEQVKAAERALEQLKLRYKPNHPDVRAMERTIRDLRAQLDEERRNPPPAEPPTVTELARQKRLKELREDMGMIDEQIAARERQEERLREVSKGYQQNVDIVPTRESELVELMRDYGTLQNAYTSLLGKREESQLAANLERRQIGEQFRVLDEANLPERPFNLMQRMGRTAGGPIGALLFGLVLAGLLEFLDSTFKSEQDVLRALSLPVLALVPVIASDRELQQKRRRSLAWNLAGSMVLLASVAVVIAWRLQP